jgi:drug/metabolite transporter (DMT)-like permease
MRGSTADAMLIATVTLWALNFTVSKYILDKGFHPLAYASIRYGAAALVFFAITIAIEGTVRLARRDVVLAAFAAFVLLLNQLCFIYALRFTTATTVALLFGTLPIFTALLARGTGVERQGSRFWLAALLSFGGVVLVAIGSGGNVSADLKGDALAVGGAVTWAAYSVALAPLMRHYSPFRLSSVFLLAVTVPLFALGVPQIHHQEWTFGPLVWIGFAFAVLGPLVVTNLLWFTAIDRVGPSRASLFANLQPFLAAIVALLVLSESVTTLQVAGGFALAAGIAIAPRVAPPPEPGAD